MHQLLQRVFTNTRKSVYSKVILLIASDWCSLIVVTNVFFFFCIWFLRTSSINFSYSLSLKVNWVYSSQYLFYHLLYMARAASRIWIHRLFFQCPIFGVRNNIWDQAFCVIELPLQLESWGEAHRTGFKPSLNLYIRIMLN